MDDNHLHTETQPLDVGTILETIRAELRAHHQTHHQQTTSPLERDLRHALDDIELYRVISAHWPLLGTTLPQRIIALINKIVRRLLRWYINPIVEQQNAYNDIVARTLHLLAEAYSDLAAQLHTIESTPSPNNYPPATNTLHPSPPPAPPASHHLPVAHAPSQNNPATPTYATLIAHIHTRAAAEPPASFPDLDLRASAPYLHLRQNINAHWSLLGTTLPQRTIALIHKLIRRLLRWYINPIVEQHNAANAAFTTALLTLIHLDDEQRAHIAAKRASKTRNTPTLHP